MRFRILFAFLLLAATAACAQSRLQKAQTLWGKKDYDGAIALLQQHLNEPDAYPVLGGWLYQRGRFPEAAEVFAKVLPATKNGAQKFGLPLARCLYRAGRYQEAARALQQYPSGHPEAAKLAQSVRWALAQKTEAVTPQSLGVRINSPYPESFPQPAADGQKLYFTRRVKGIDDDLMRALPDSCGGWYSAESLPYPVNSRRQERAQFVSADGHYIFFGRDEIRSEDGWTGGGADLYMAYCTQPDDTVWTTPLPFGATINTPAYEGMPTLSPDNNTLYFVSDRAGGYGGLDVWYSHFHRGMWQVPVNAGPEVNTAGNEISPFLSADGQFLFFASDGQGASFGGYDLYRAQRVDTFWRRIENLGLPLNSAADDISPAIGARGDSLYFASDRQGPPGNTDLWCSALPDHLRPRPVRPIRGWLLDSVTRQPVTNAWVYCSSGPEAVGNFRSNRGDGSFSAFLQRGRAYTFSVMHQGYKSFWMEYQPVPHDSLRQDTLRLALLPESYVAPRYDSLLLRLPFRKNEVTLSDTLRRMLTALKPDLSAETSELLINSYTDNSGTPMLNEEISTQRAQLVAEWLKRAGLPAEKINAQGWGEAQPLVPNESDAGRDQNRRVEIILRK